MYVCEFVYMFAKLIMFSVIAATRAGSLTPVVVIPVIEALVAAPGAPATLIRREM